MREYNTNAYSFDSLVSRIIQEYADEIKDSTNEIARKLAKLGAKQVNSNAAAMFKGTGKYARSWTVSAEKKRFGESNVIHSSMPGLPHLLENGHASRYGGRVSGRAHIAPVEEELVKKFQEEVIDVIQGR